MEFKNNTYSKKIKPDRSDRLDVEIGDSKQIDFIPQAKFMRWDNEVNLSVRLKDKSKVKATVIEKKGKIEHKKGDKTCRFYDRTDVTDGGFEFDVLLDKKPKSNVLEFTIETKGLDFFYQSELTAEEIAEGVVRPENVIGSYAAYHKEKAGDYSKMGGKDYKCGKAFHIYRPEIVDAKGNKVWGILNIDTVDKILTVEIPQDFYDNAVYPITVDPTFGYTTVGASRQWWSANNYRGNAYIAASSGNISKISAYAYEDKSGDVYTKGVLLDKTESNDVFIVANGISNGALVPAGNANQAWYDMNFSASPAIVQDTPYFIAMIVDSGSSNYGINMDTGSLSYFYHTGDTYASPGDWGSIWGTGVVSKYSVYATYTEGGGATKYTKDQGLAYKVKKEIDKTSGLVYRMKKEIGATKALAYRVRVAKSEDAGIDYAVKSSGDESAGLAYLVKAEAEKTTGIEYAVKVKTTKESGIAYLVSVPKIKEIGMSYLAKAEKIIEKGLAYLVKAPVVKDSGLAYMVKARAETETGLEYQVESEAVIEQGLEYRVKIEGVEDQGIEYLVKKETIKESGLAYKLKTIIEKNETIGYMVKSEQSADLGMVYDVATETKNTVSTGVEYMIKAEARKEVGLSYLLTTSGEVEIGMEYDVQTKTEMEKEAGLAYLVKVEAGEDLGVEYQVKANNDLPGAIDYKVKSEVGLDRGIAYQIKAGQAKEVSLEYLVRSGNEVAQGVKYEVKTEQETETGLAYRLRMIRAEDLVIGYMLRSGVEMELGMEYVAFINTKKIIETGLAYRVSVESVQELGMTYALRVYPYRKKTGIFAGKINIFSKKAKVFNPLHKNR